MEDLKEIIDLLRAELMEIRKENAELRTKLTLYMSYAPPSPTNTNDNHSEEDNGEWRSGNKRFRRENPTRRSPTITTQNSFAMLEDETMEEDNPSNRPSPSPSPSPSATSIPAQQHMQIRKIEFPPMPRKSVPLTEALKPILPKAPPRIPPIKVRNSNSFPSIEKMADERQIKIKFAKQTNQGLQIYPETADDHRKLTSGLKEHDQEYFSYTLPDDKLLRVVIRGIPGHETEKSIKEKLESRGFEVLETTQLYRRVEGEKHYFPMMLVKLPRTEASKTIFNLTHLGFFKIQVETQRTKQTFKQCFRCQSFGHTQSTCHLKPRCVKCSEEHWSFDCPKPKTTPAVCANCRLPHPANYRGCKNYPGNVKKTKTEERRFNPNKVEEGVSYSSKVAPKKTELKEPNMTEMLAQVTSLLTKIAGSLNK